MRIPTLIRNTAILIFSMTVLASCAGRDKPAGGPEIIRTGVLAYANPDKCPWPDGCGPAFLLMDHDFKVLVPVTGDVDPGLAGRIIKVIGPLTPVPKEELSAAVYSGPNKKIVARKTELVSRLAYTDFVVASADARGQALFGCQVPWDKTFGWEADRNRAVFIVRLTDVLGGLDPAPFIEFHFDANSGELVAEKASPSNINPCENPA